MAPPLLRLYGLYWYSSKPRPWTASWNNFLHWCAGGHRDAPCGACCFHCHNLRSVSSSVIVTLSDAPTLFPALVNPKEMTAIEVGLSWLTSLLRTANNSLFVGVRRNLKVGKEQRKIDSETEHIQPGFAELVLSMECAAWNLMSCPCFKQPPAAHELTFIIYPEDLQWYLMLNSYPPLHSIEIPGSRLGYRIKTYPLPREGDGIEWPYVLPLLLPSICAFHAPLKVEGASAGLRAVWT